jgi:ABC-2 type transport system ATP-binding protein
MTSVPVVETAGLAKRFGQTAALDALDLRIEPGEVFGFLGPNGAGKTTTILDLDKQVRAFSTGNRQKVALIAAFMTRPELLVLDEPTGGLDPLRKVVFRQCLAEAKARGQTVLLSSHVLGEVEESADRVGLLRRGRLVETGTLEELRHLSAVRIEASFAGPAPDLRGVAGVEGIQVTDHAVAFHVHGPIAPALTAVAAARPLRLTSREPSLEDVFLAHYGAED